MFFARLLPKLLLLLPGLLLLLLLAPCAAAADAKPSAEAVGAWRKAHRAYEKLELPAALLAFGEAEAGGFDGGSVQYFLGMTLLSGVDKPGELVGVGVGTAAGSGSEQQKQQESALAHVLRRASEHFSRGQALGHGGAIFVCGFLESNYRGLRCKAAPGAGALQAVGKAAAALAGGAGVVEAAAKAGSVHAQLAQAYEDMHGDTVAAATDGAPPGGGQRIDAPAAAGETEQPVAAAVVARHKAAYKRYMAVAQAVMGQKNDGMLPFEHAEQVSLYNDRQVAWKAREEGWIESLHADVGGAGAAAKAAAAYRLGSMSMTGEAGLAVDIGRACAYYGVADDAGAGATGEAAAAAAGRADCYRYGWRRVGARAALEAEIAGRLAPPANSSSNATTAADLAMRAKDETAVEGGADAKAVAVKARTASPEEEEDDAASSAADAAAAAAAAAAENTKEDQPPTIEELRKAGKAGLKPQSTQNLTRAAELYGRAIELGSTQARVGLGHMLQEGAGVPQDIVGASEHFEAAAHAGDVNGIMSLGMLHFGGWLDNANRNMTAALHWFRQAAAAGHMNAQVCTD